MNYQCLNGFMILSLKRNIITYLLFYTLKRNYKLRVYIRGRQAEGTRGPNFELERSSRAAVLVLIKLLELLSFSKSEF